MDNLEKFVHEVKIISDVLHENIVRFYGVCIQDDSIFIVTEFMAHGSILNYLRNEPGKRIKFNTIIHFASQVDNEEYFFEINNSQLRLYLDCKGYGLS
jgi:serine/threonine protein kinase